MTATTPISSTQSSETTAGNVDVDEQSEPKISKDTNLLPYVLIGVLGGVALIVGLAMTASNFYLRSTTVLSYRPVEVENNLASSFRRNYHNRPVERVI